MTPIMLEPNVGNISQENNGITAFINRLNGSGGLESCHMDSIEGGLETLGIDQRRVVGPYLQPADAYMMLVHDKKYFKPQSYMTQPINRYLEAGMWICNRFYQGQVHAELISLTDDVHRNANLTYDVLIQDNTVGIFNLKNPGHYIAAYGMTGPEEVYYNDSWRGNTWDKDETTRKRHMELNEFAKNIEHAILKITRL